MDDETMLKDLIHMPKATYKAIIQGMTYYQVDRLMNQCHITIERMNENVSAHHNYDLIKKYSDLYKVLHKVWIVKGKENV